MDDVRGNSPRGSAGTCSVRKPAMPRPSVRIGSEPWLDSIRSGCSWKPFARVNGRLRSVVVLTVRELDAPVPARLGRHRPPASEDRAAAVVPGLLLPDHQLAGRADGRVGAARALSQPGHVRGSAVRVPPVRGQRAVGRAVRGQRSVAAVEAAAVQPGRGDPRPTPGRLGHRLRPETRAADGA